MNLANAGNPDLVSQVSRSYDSPMRITRESQSIRESAARHVDYGYDKAANVLTLTYPSGTTIATSYDALGRGDVLKRDGNPIADYNYLGQRLKALTFETGTDDVQLTQAFDGLGRLTRMTYAQTGNAGLPDFSYGFDAASNITRKGFEHRSGAPSEDYGYDTLHRLTRTTFGQRAADPYEGFVYDHLGNHLVQDDNGTTVAGLFNAVNEQTKRGTTALSHDLRGNLTADDTSGGREYFYDRQNLLTRVEDGSSNRIASYVYDALGRRIEKDVQGGAVTEFYWNGQQLVEETDASGTVQRKYLWAPSPGRGGYIDDLVQFIDRTGGSDVAYFACRHHNFNVVALLSSSGGVVERYDYNPYGKRFVLESDYSDDADGVSDVAFQVGHQGLMHDAETGLVYNRARMLHPLLGRFVQHDILGYPDGVHLYQYLRSAPTGFVDPQGDRAKCRPYRPPYIAGGPDDPNYYSGYPLNDDAQDEGTQVPAEGTHPSDCCGGYEFDRDTEFCCKDKSIGQRASMYGSQWNADCCLGDGSIGKRVPKWKELNYPSFGSCVSARYSPPGPVSNFVLSYANWGLATLLGAIDPPLGVVVGFAYAGVGAVAPDHYAAMKMSQARRYCGAVGKCM